MASPDAKQGSKTTKGKTMTQEQILAGFQELRQQQRAVASKIAELDMERKEHDLVVETLKEVDQSRKCFRMVGGVLVERTVNEVLPALINNHQQLGKVVESLTGQLELKGKDLNTYREQYNIRVRGEEDATSGGKDKDQNKASTQGVLVAQGSS